MRGRHTVHMKQEGPEQRQLNTSLPKLTLDGITWSAFKTSIARSLTYLDLMATKSRTVFILYVPLSIGMNGFPRNYNQ